MHATERAVLAAIDEAALIEAIGELVAIRSLDGTTEENSAQEYVATLLQRCGLDVDRWEIDFAALRQHPAHSWEVERPRGLGVVGMLGAERGGRSLIINGHVDVVPAGDEANWRFAPWRLSEVEGRLYGRGSVDMKGALCCAIFAAKAIRDAGVQLKGQLLIHSVIGEEDGGCGTLATILRGHRADGAIVVEPTMLCVAPVQAGAHNFRLTVPGRAAHGCVREEGVSAIEKFEPLHRAILALEAERNRRIQDPLFERYRLPNAICIGSVRAGSWASSVAESLVAEGRYGIAAGEDIATARRELEAAIAKAAMADEWLSAHPPVLEWWGGTFDPAATPVDHPIVATVAGALHDATGQVAQLEGMTYGADMRLLVNVGHIPTVLFGPGDVRRAHRPDEWVGRDELRAATRSLALAALRYCGYE